MNTSPGLVACASPPPSATPIPPDIYDMLTDARRVYQSLLAICRHPMPLMCTVARGGHEMLGLEDGVPFAVAERDIPIEPLLASVGKQGRGVRDDASFNRCSVVSEVAVGDHLIERILVRCCVDDHLDARRRRSADGAGHHAREGELNTVLNDDTRYAAGKGERGRYLVPHALLERRADPHRSLQLVVLGRRGFEHP